MTRVQQFARWECKGRSIYAACTRCLATQLAHSIAGNNDNCASVCISKSETHQIC